MTKSTEKPGCRWCGRLLADSTGPGRPREYCRPSCKQRAYELRQRQAAGTLQPGEVPITTDDFEHLRDAVYRITTALEDVDADVAADGADCDYEAAFRHVYLAASELRGFEVTPAPG